MKKVILAFTKFYLPGYKAGGPIRTLVNMADRLCDEFDFKIVTLDRDSGEARAYSDIHPCQWTRQGSSTVYYCPPEKLSIRLLTQLIRETNPDVIYLNSFFDSTFTQRVLWARRLRLIPDIPIILAPRGEFSSGALGLKVFKKKVYLSLTKFVGLYKGITWQASSTLEKKDILRSVVTVSDHQVHVALNLAPVLSSGDETQSCRERNTQVLRICFLSRISPKKNLDYALKVLRSVRSQILFTIYGPKEVPGYWDECQKLIGELPNNVQVVWGGELMPTQVQHELSKHHLFLFPTRGENYGHVIHEALTAGLPVLISDQTPWGEVVNQGVGWCISLTEPECFSQVIDDVAAWSPEHVNEVANKCRSYARTVAESDSVLDDNRRLFYIVLAQESKL